MRQSRGDPPPSKAVTKTWRKTGARVLIRFKARGLVKKLNLVAIIRLKEKRFREKKKKKSVWNEDETLVSCQHDH